MRETIHTSVPEAIALERRYVLQTYRRPDFVLVRGEGVRLFDEKGRAYLDAVAGIAVNALGYGDPEIVATLRTAAEGLIHVSNLYHTEPQARLAQALVECSFADRVFFCNSGTEAVEAALKFARKYARERYGAHKTQFVAFTNSFHGRTMGALSTTATEKYRIPFEPLVPGVHFVPFNNLRATEEAITDHVCAVLVEPIQGEGGVHLATAEFLQGLRALCNERGALLIFDEIQCGLGRSGTLWAHESSGVTPDLMTLAKPLAGGLPMGAVLMTQAVADVIAPGDHGSTFAAGPLICQVAQVVLRRINSRPFLAEVQAKGEYLGTHLNQHVRPHRLVRDVRGRGLIWGIECNTEALTVVNAAYRHGLLVCAAGTHVVRLLPPLIITRAEIDEMVDKLVATLEDVAQEMVA
ncbi:MAG: aspartate aminotransferase family protein [Anaerolineae bacterium]|nr:aspartate aminotransferase family protein [Anaerolineae bacterium]MDW8070323.1 aspartate aminotransferase family protein [Anaerolineae bacterium]